jgi:hypothetical protein
MPAFLLLNVSLMLIFVASGLSIIFFLISTTEFLCMPCETHGVFRFVNSLCILSAIAALYFFLQEDDSYDPRRFQLLMQEEEIILEVQSDTSYDADNSEEDDEQDILYEVELVEAQEEEASDTDVRSQHDEKEVTAEIST